eukprot:COSAG05_NODE_174_length_14944_cov_32.054092_4_plen_93_part_00
MQSNVLRPLCNLWYEYVYLQLRKKAFHRAIVRPQHIGWIRAWQLRQIHGGPKHRRGIAHVKKRCPTFWHHRNGTFEERDYQPGRAEEVIART